MWLKVTKSLFQRRSWRTCTSRRHFGATWCALKAMKAQTAHEAGSSVTDVPSKKVEWDKAVSDAEKVVGYPSSYLSLRCLLSDEFSNIALHIRKLVGTGHPLLKTAKKLVYNGKHNLQTRGLVVLLISRAAGHPQNSDQEQAHSSGIINKQRTLAEVTEMIHIAHLIHRGIVNVDKFSLPEGTTIQDMHFGNKIAILCGDYLLSSACTNVASFRNNIVVELISSAIRDAMRSEFIGEHDDQGQAVPSATMTISEWAEKNFLAAASLVANSCQAALELAGHRKELQDSAFQFGKEVALAWQVHSELQPFVDVQQYPPGTPFDLTSSPVLFHLQEDCSLLEYIRQHSQNLDNLNFEKVHKAILDGNGVADARRLCQQHSKAALSTLNSFRPSDARDALENIVYMLAD